MPMPYWYMRKMLRKMQKKMKSHLKKVMTEVLEGQMVEEGEIKGSDSPIADWHCPDVFILVLLF